MMKKTALAFSLGLVILASAACQKHGAAQSSATAAGNILGGKPLYSSHNEELVIRDFFHDRRDGFFVDVGCYLPIRFSNTFYLEKHLGWSGIGVDALAELADGWKRSRPRSRFFAYFVSDHSDTLDTFYRAESRDISTGIQGRVDDPNIKDHEGQFEAVKVPTITLTKLLDDNGLKKIDLLSMDIEGAEPEALAGFDIERFRPELACVEVSWQTREAVRAYFATHRYRRLTEYTEVDPINEYYAPLEPPRAR